MLHASMPFEIPIYRPKLLNQFEEWEKKYYGDPLREDAYIRANRIQKMLSGN